MWQSLPMSWRGIILNNICVGVENTTSMRASVHAPILQCGSLSQRKWQEQVRFRTAPVLYGCSTTEKLCTPAPPRYRHFSQARIRPSFAEERSACPTGCCRKPTSVLCFVLFNVINESISNMCPEMRVALGVYGRCCGGTTLCTGCLRAWYTASPARLM